ncbi:cyclic lactone autoinducer peptide [bacterium]|uniref:cyclic lactone autoinducer peptide n=1 Tax=Agathobacter rectalis TaxID=39491 RepID=UPI0027D2875F|nr:cyclic lactone autoinducer peptide [Agathobacter rectalis]MCB6950263.1 cyclic lactone autoinducer peptide [Agathobacter rectalis]MCI6044601.1 cyclic lactone autoinducer peptide [bacterium]MDY3022591.1 cyclic lactone autoinducer peptide [Oliverpabstia sp.]MDY3999642.1 cyclic lactone autoinducer peptide [Blautia sp.]
MKKIRNFLNKNIGVAKGLASLALVFSVFAANSRCMCIYHDAEKPEELKKLRKF